MFLAMSLPPEEFIEVFEPKKGEEPVRLGSIAPKRKGVDLASVPPSQWKMHDRLEDWARWCRGSQQQAGRAGTPMFDLYRSSDARRDYGETTSVPIDKDRALLIHFAIVHPHFPDHQRKALQWSYLRPRNPTAFADGLGTTLEGLRDLIHAGRQSLIDKGLDK